MGPTDMFEPDSEDEDESLTVPKPSAGDLVCSQPSFHSCQLTNSQEDPVVEYEDEFGRIRTAPRSEVPRHLAPQPAQEDEDE